MSHDRTTPDAVGLPAETTVERRHAFRPKNAVSRFLLGVLISFAATMGASLEAQTQNIERWTVQDGLASSPVSSITQTQDGVLWLGTRSGLTRFDGTGFTPFKHNPAELSSLGINRVATGPDSQLYAGTDRGLAVVSHGQVRMLHQNTGCESSKVVAVLPGGEDEAWFGTAEGVLCHYVHGSVDEVGSDVLPHEPIYGLAKAPDGALWIATASGLFLRRDGRVSAYEPVAPLPVGPIHDLALSKTGAIYAASDAGLVAIEGRNWRLLNRKEGLPSDALNVLDTDVDGVLWIGTRHGLAKLENGVVRSVPSVTCDVNAVYADKEKSVWVACEDVAGLTRVTSPPIKFLSVPRTAGAVVVSSLVEDRDDAVWMGSKAGVFQYQHGQFKHYTHRDGLPSESINAMSFSSAGILWVATDRGVASFVKGHFEPLEADQKGPTESFYTVLQDRQETLWATSERGLLRRRAGQSTWEIVPDVTNSIKSLREGNDGTVLVNTYTQGLLRFAGESKTAFTKDSGLGSNRVLDSVPDERGTLWVWTDGGLSRIRVGQCANIGPEKGLPRAIEGSMAYDRSNHLWLRTQDGTAVVDVAEANHVLDFGGSLRHVRYFARDNAFGDGLSTSPNWQPLAMRSTGEIWVMSLAGIAIVDPAILQRSAPPLTPQVTSLVTDRGPRDYGAPVKVQPGDLHLHIAYAVPYLLGATSREYRYRLVGYDTDWRDNGTKREATYNDLPAGTFHFQVSARLPFEAWGEASAPIEIKVLPHLYQTWWWYTLLAFLACAVLAVGYRLRLRALRKQYAAMMDVRSQERSRLARELHDTLSQGMMAIHVQIQLARALLHKEPDTASAHLEIAQSITRQSASETRRSITALRSDLHEPTTLREILDRAVARFREGSQIALDTKIEAELPEVSEEVSHEIARITEEALTNVRLHSGAAQASLSARRYGKKLRVEVVDNGQGFDPSAIGNDQLPHFGLTGMKERAERIRGTLETSSTPGEGTRVVLEVPCFTRRSVEGGADGLA